MIKIYIISISLIISAGLTSLSFAQEGEMPDQAAENFFYRCAGCHTVGGGNLSGPDLKGSTQWNDADLGGAIKRMEKNTGPLSESDIHQMIEFLKDLSVSDRITKQKEKIQSKSRSELPAPSYETGQRIFRGQQALVNGGPACFSCHRFVNDGGSLGPDLTQIKDRASGVVLQSAIENSSYKIMRPIYEKHKITKEEALHLSEFLSHPEKNNRILETTIDEILSLVVAGVCGFFILLWFLNRQRKGRTRENLVQKSKKGNLS